DLKCWAPRGFPPGSGRTVPGPPIRAWRAILKRTLPPCAPRSAAPALTVTVSPARKRLRGRKLSPSPSECCLMVPVCLPLREPRTLMPVRCAAPAPRKLIWVRAEAVGVPAVGKTATLLAAPDEDEEPHPTATMAASAASTISADVSRGDTAKRAGSDQPEGATAREVPRTPPPGPRARTAT